MTTLPGLGFIGLGIMGRPMAGHLLRAGYPLAVHTRTRAKAEELVAGGARWCATPAEVAANCDLLLMNLPDAPDCERVLFGSDGACGTGGPGGPGAPGDSGGLKAGAVVVDFATISPDAARDFATRLAARGVIYLDAPVTGGQVGAEHATLTILVGGPGEAFERVRPLLEKVGRKIVHVGPSGAGQALKACNQIMCAVNMLGVCEAVQLARASGLDLRQAIDALGAGAGGSWAWTTLGGKIAAGDLQPAFMIKLMQKDLRIVQAAAARLFGRAFPATELAEQMLSAVAGEPGGTELGTQAMVKAYERSHPAPRA